MEWNQFLLWLNIVVTQYCEKNEPKDKSNCVEVIKECVLDGEQLDWCKKNWK